MRRRVVLWGVVLCVIASIVFYRADQLASHPHPQVLCTYDAQDLLGHVSVPNFYGCSVGRCGFLGSRLVVFHTREKHLRTQYILAQIRERSGTP